MKIAYVAADPAPSNKGAGVRITRTIATLRQLGHEVAVLTPASAAVPAARLPDVAHDTVVLDEENYLARMLRFRHVTAAWLARQRADVVQFRGIWEGLPAVEWARARGARAIFEANGFPSIELPYHFPGLHEHDALLDKILAEEHGLLARADRVITVSRTGRRHLLMRGVAAERIKLVPNAVDLTAFTPPAVMPPDAPPYRLLYQGTLAPWQGLSILLEALVPFRSSGEVELMIVGPAKQAWRAQIRALARRLRVHHLVRLAPAVPQAELIPSLQTAHVCVAPMPADARNVVQGCCPIKILEYMATGRPIVATAIAPLQEILTHDLDARLVPDRPQALADGIAWMLSHPAEREALGATARLHALARYGPERFAARLADALDFSSCDA